MSQPIELRPRHWHCHRLLSALLDKHDPLKAFGNVLANIQILPALLGRSLVHLKMSCPTSSKLNCNFITIYSRVSLSTIVQQMVVNLQLSE
jgi:hypothetical protein